MTADPGGGLRLLRAFVWLRWRVMANSLSARRRSTWQRVGAMAEALGRVVVGLLVLGVSLGGVAVGLVLPALLVRLSAEVTESGFTEADGVLLGVRIALGFFLLMIVLVPAIQGLAGSGLPRARLLLLPIRLRTLHRLETAAHLGDPWVLPLVFALLAVGVGSLWVAGVGALVVIAAGLLLVLAVAAHSATVTFGVALLLRDRRRAERLALVVTLVWITVALLPSWLEFRDGDEPADSEAPAATEAPVAVEAPDQPGRDVRAIRAITRPPVAMWLIPSEAYAQALRSAVLGRPAAALAPTGVLALSGLLLFGLSRYLWGRLLASPAAAGGKRGATELPRPFRIPGLSPAASTVAWGQFLSLTRTLAGRLALAVAPVMTVVLGTMLKGDLASLAPGGQTLGSVGGAVLLGVGAMGLAMLSMQSFLINQFALDGSGFVLTSLAPVTARDLVLGKWAAWAGLAGGLVLVTTAVVMGLAPDALPWWPALLLGGVGVYAVLAVTGSWLSLLLPKAVDLNKLGRAAQPHQLAGLVFMFVIGVVLSIPVVAGGLAWAITGSVVAVTAAEALWAAAALLAARLLLVPVAHGLEARREGVYLALQEGRKS